MYYLLKKKIRYLQNYRWNVNFWEQTYINNLKSKNDWGFILIESWQYYTNQAQKIPSL